MLFLVGQPFKFLSKIEVFYVPIIGQAMWMTGMCVCFVFYVCLYMSMHAYSTHADVGSA